MDEYAALVEARQKQVEEAADRLAESTVELNLAKERRNNAFREQLLQASLVKFREGASTSLWPRRIAVPVRDALGFGDLPENLAYFVFRVCGFSDGSKEAERLFDITQDVTLYFDVEDNGTAKLVGAHQDGLFSFGDCRGGQYEEMAQKDPGWDGDY
jgi:hypothetical protein